MVDLRSSPIPSLNGRDHLRGDAHLPLVIVYGDFSCPYCALAHRRLRNTQLRIAFRHFALKSRPRALALAHTVEAAANQGAFWQMHDALFEAPAYIEDPHLWAHANRLGLDLERLREDRMSVAVTERVKGDMQDALRGGVARTPTLLIDGINHPGVPTSELLDALSARNVR